jgi:uncharacterized protein (DUF433 family)
VSGSRTARGKWRTTSTSPKPATSLRYLRRARSLVLSDPEIMGGDPVFRGTRIPVHIISELVTQGSNQAELLESYPRLTAEMIRLAPVCAAATRGASSRATISNRCAPVAGGSTPAPSPRHVSQFLNSVARPEFHIERGAAPGAAFSAEQLPLKRHEARVPGTALQQRRVRNDGLVPAGVAARAHQVKDAQVFEAEGVARRHGRACSFLSPII